MTSSPKSFSNAWTNSRSLIPGPLSIDKSVSVEYRNLTGIKYNSSSHESKFSKLSITRNDSVGLHQHILKGNSVSLKDLFFAYPSSSYECLYINRLATFWINSLSVSSTPNRIYGMQNKHKNIMKLNAEVTKL